MEAKTMLKKVGKVAVVGIQKYGASIIAASVGAFIGGAVVGPIKEGEDPQQYACRLAGNAAAGSALAYCVGSTVMGTIHNKNLRKEIKKLETELETKVTNVASEEGGDENEA